MVYSNGWGYGKSQENCLFLYLFFIWFLEAEKFGGNFAQLNKNFLLLNSCPSDFGTTLQIVVSPDMNELMNESIKAWPAVCMGAARMLFICIRK